MPRALFKSWQAREGKPDIGERRVATPPLLGGAFDMPKDIGRNGLPIGYSEQRENALPVSIEIENRIAAVIPRRTPNDGADTEDESRIIDLNRSVDRAVPKALVKPLSE